MPLLRREVARGRQVPDRREHDGRSRDATGEKRRVLRGCQMIQSDTPLCYATFEGIVAELRKRCRRMIIAVEYASDVRDDKSTLMYAFKPPDVEQAITLMKDFVEALDDDDAA